MADPVIVEHQLDSVRDLLNALTLPSEQIHASSQDWWIFRGQANSDWPLTPSAYRKESLQTFEHRIPNFQDFASWTEQQQSTAEFKLIADFYRFADRCGLQLPEDSREVREYLEGQKPDRLDRVSFGDDETWPPSKLLSIMALAQHHRLPTRLLDCTRSPFIAAFFAAHQALEEKRRDERKGVDRPFGTMYVDRMAVWGFAAGRHTQILSPLLTLSTRIQLVTAPAYSNQNLAAQQGIHALIRPDIHDPEFKSHVYYRSRAERAAFDVAIADELRSPNSLVKLTLRASQAPELLDSLALQGIHSASLFPGYAGVVQLMQESNLWEGAASGAAMRRMLESYVRNQKK